MHAESTNTYLNVSVYASIVNYAVYVIPLQSQTENITYKLLYQLAETLDDLDCRPRDSQNNTMLQENNIISTPLYDASGGMLLFQLPTPSQANFILCFELTVCVPDFTKVVIEGSIDINGVASTIGDIMLSSAITASTFTPKHTISSIHAEDTTTLIAATTLVCVIVIILTILTITTLIIIVRRKRKWRSGLSKTSNIYE